jgi:hypothetical protein
LDRHFRNVPWWQRWDVCLQLRTAVVNAYLEGNLNPRSFRQLTQSQRLLSMLTRELHDTKRGRRFLSAMTAEG